MPTFSEAQAAYKKTPVTVVVMQMDFCALTYGTPPCGASGGTPCYNTWQTCKARTTYVRTLKDYAFSSASVRSLLPDVSGIGWGGFAWGAGPAGKLPPPRPYLTNVTYYPTEIKDSITQTARVKATLLDEPDGDVGIDPYLSQRPGAQGTFWRKFIARNESSYKNRMVCFYEGYLEAPEDLRLRFCGKIDTASFDQSGRITFEVVDYVRALKDLKFPPKLNGKLGGDISPTDTQLTISETTGLEAPPGYIRLDDEIISYAQLSGNQLLQLGRGQFGTTAAAHNADTQVMAVWYIPPTNAFDIMKNVILMGKAGYGADRVDPAVFDAERDWPGGEPDFSAVITESTDLQKLLFEIADMLDCRVWQNEENKIAVRRMLANKPGRSYKTLRGSENIKASPAPVPDLNEKSRYTRTTAYWEPKIFGKISEPDDYYRIYKSPDIDIEGPNGLGEEREKIIYCRWISLRFLQEEAASQFMKLVVMRRTRNLREPMPQITCEAGLKDSDVLTGDFVKLSTSRLQNVDGSGYSDVACFIAKREPVKEGIKLTIQRAPRRRVCIIAPPGTPAYTQATAAQREYGFLCSADGRMSNGDEPYTIY